ncbi:unnamed protein product [Dicrocoelium dendriticum]|nr:unnamed protein product [Dicrocoelium dendriticum]
MLQSALILLSFSLLRNVFAAFSEEGLMLPNKCEVCRILVNEVIMRLNETKSSSLLTVSPSRNTAGTIEYNRSELRLLEVLESPPICNRMLEYRIHKERTGLRRFDKGVPETVQSLTELVNRGVDVKLDVPFEMWDRPSIEITTLFKQCVALISSFQDDIEEWFYDYQGSVDLLNYLCRDRVLDDSEKALESKQQLYLTCTVSEAPSSEREQWSEVKQNTFAHALTSIK